ncbi:MAG: hypothetical protein GXO55_11400 [Chloroflexi bacterium]|nr:hypothetical protein [Chloroflexota bacterium]
MKTFARVVHRFSTDAEFRQALARDMAGTLAREGWKLSEEDLRTVRQLLDMYASLKFVRAHAPYPTGPGWHGYADIRTVMVEAK